MNETLLDISRQFWEAMEHADEVGMRACAHPDCSQIWLRKKEQPRPRSPWPGCCVSTRGLYPSLALARKIA